MWCNFHLYIYQINIEWILLNWRNQSIVPWFQWEIAGTAMFRLFKYNRWFGHKFPLFFVVGWVDCASHVIIPWHGSLAIKIDLHQERHAITKNMLAPRARSRSHESAPTYFLSCPYHQRANLTQILTFLILSPFDLLLLSYSMILPTLWVL